MQYHSHTGNNVPFGAQNLRKIGERKDADAGDPARRERLDPVRRWWGQDWLTIDPKLRSSIIEGLSVFLSVFDLSDVAATFCTPKPPAEPPAVPDAPAAETAAVASQLHRSTR